MKERIEQLQKEGFDAASAEAIATVELERAKQLLKEGFAADKALPRAQAEIKLERLIREKRLAGLTDEQARSVANEQLANDARVAALEAKTKAAPAIEARAATLEAIASGPSPEEVKALVSNQVKATVREIQQEEAELRQKLEAEHRKEIDALKAQLAAAKKEGAAK